MSSVAELIIDYLNRNRVSTTEVADCLGKSGAICEVMPINRGHYCAGLIKYVYTYDESNWEVHRQIANIEEGKIIFVESFNCAGRAIFGELVSKYLLLYRQSKAIVALGKMRDAAALIRENYPIWCIGFNPVGCFNRKPDSGKDITVMKESYENYENAIAVCDDCGVVVIPKEEITLEFLKKLENIESQEDIWFDRLDHFKENTFQIVCEKQYLTDKKYMQQRLESVK